MAIQNASSQITTHSDSTIWTFTVQLDENTFEPFESCFLFNTVNRFKVLKSNFKFPVYTIYIKNKYPLRSTIEDPNMITIKGYVTFEKVSIDGCFSSRRDETRIYVSPIFIPKYF